MSIQDRPLWRDYSANQDNPDTPEVVNVRVAVENGVVGIITRAGSSWTYEDPTFRYIYNRAGELGIYRSSYWNFSPGADVDTQLAKWFSVHPVMDIIPRFVAVEINWNDLKPYQIAAEFYNFSETYLQREGERPGIYTRKQLADLWLTSFLDADWLNEHWWWLAQYDDYRHTEQDKPLIPPNKVDLSRCWLRQTADKMVGFPRESESIHVDRDRFMFENMDQWIADNFGDDAIPPVPPEEGCCVELEKKLELHTEYVEQTQRAQQDLISDNANEVVKTNTVLVSMDKKLSDCATDTSNIVKDFINLAVGLTNLDQKTVDQTSILLQSDELLLNGIEALKAIAEKNGDEITAQWTALENDGRLIKDLQARYEMMKDAIKVQDAIVDSNRLVGSQNFELIEGLQGEIDDITIPETNHSHRKIFSWLFNKK